MRVKNSPGGATRGAGHTLMVLVVTTLTLTATTWGTLLYSTAATIITADFGMPVTAIGYQVGLAYLSAMFCTLYAGNMTVALGARRTLIVAMMLTGAGSLLTTIFSLVGICIGTVLLGFGHGLVNPAAAVLLERIGTNSRRSLLFSIKQTGTPLGGLVVALVTPTLAERFGWQYAAYALTAGAVAIALLTWIVSRDWDATSMDDRRRLSPSPLEALGLVLRSPMLRLLTLMAMCFSSVQICVMTFLSPFLVEELGFSLIVGGGLVAMAQVSGGIGRPFWGLIADATGSNTLVLRCLGLVTAACCLAAAGLTSNSAYWLVSGLVIILGATSIGWNGLFTAEIVNLSKKGDASHATAGATFFTFASAVVGPSVFASMQRAVGDYGLTIAILAAVAVAGSMATIWLARRRSRIASA